jgi:translation initiation factor 4G
MDEFTVAKANESDCDFLGVAIRQAERGHTGRGMWDVFIEDSDIENIVALALTHACLHGEDSIHHYSRFFIARNSATMEPVASACGYIYPCVNDIPTIDAVGKAMIEIAGWDESKIKDAKEKLDFLWMSLPIGLDWSTNGRWMIEGVYTDPSYRGKGLGEKILRAAVEAGREAGREAREAGHAGCDSCWITCAVGNDGACKLYERVGFTVLGEGNSDLCMKNIFTPGFEVLEYKY